jgi:phage terminase large subunit
MQTMGHYKDERWNRTDYIYTFDTGSRIEFFSADQPGKVRGPRRDILFLNEANNIPWETYDQLSIRTKKIVWLDWNPTHEFWWYDEVMPHNDVDFLTLTYKDNEALDAAIVKEIESHKHNKNWWLVYGLGQLGEVESRIYTGWIVIDEIPHEAKLERRGLDFGFSADPAALIDIYKYNGGFILDERLYRKGMSNKDLADFIKNCQDPSTIVVADSAEPKSIDEMSRYEVYVQSAQKGQGSVTQGIQYVQDQRISMTKRSVNLIKEYRNYLWEVDKDGKQLPKPQSFQNHLMDALRYGLETYYYQKDRQAGIVVSKGSNYNAKESFMTNEDGMVEASALHIDIDSAIKRQSEDTRDWRYQ